MDQEAGDGRGALTQLRAYLAQSDLPGNTKLPPERELVEILGVSRGVNEPVWRNNTFEPRQMLPLSLSYEKL